MNRLGLKEGYSIDTCKFSKEDMYCLGCYFDTVSSKMCENCKIRICGMKKPYGSSAESKSISSGYHSFGV